MEYTLEDLADAFGLTTRTTRHYIEKILPPGHRAGRGRRARYGRETRDCFVFIRKARRQGLTLAQITDLLRELDPPHIDRVVRGLEELSIVPVAPNEPAEFFSSPCMAAEFPDPRGDPPAPQAPPDRWQVLYADADLQIAHRGRASPEQRTQVRLAAAYLKRLFENSG